ncbi:hypothetical protein CHCC20441_0618 [Bacillus licheniformis]|jgi:hypothetical protein|nr:hypothetical protein BLi05051 [Bacillus licheniformis DSM 13 = ATCC 14580]AKQ73477.1 hypothetical protein MUY_002345 [Bacillus licheniformis WX-02]AOP15449.1 uncharacterized protein BL1202_02502 [Bacillus licheniformis]EQM27660.1 hypothetical protein N399_12765 [Bacillus licheniformis CG-B52]PZW78572.1 hypothetical protein DEU48_1088 [Bacillus sp. AG442]TWN16444.1 hypothetical protein CHCC14564_1009 [Bacillus licheniformis LMG 17339]
MMGKKQRNRVTGLKKNNHIPTKDVIAAEDAHEKEYSARKRKNTT